jgi:hypothetical protein
MPDDITTAPAPRLVVPSETRTDASIELRLA